ncbi:MAG: 5-methyltetrahydrofolate--homocysteine methyltransferase [Lachnospiraceae bacterium]|nr:5-methyltetrahydrofolate--homocysteine methyltransferase [Lachnospiraceae bacterium]
MNRIQFRNLLENRIVMLDGATGSNLMAAGMPVGVCPEKWILDNPNHLIKLQREYIKAGSNILLAPTFTANRIKLAEYGLDKDIVDINTRLVALSKEAIAKEGYRGYVAGDLTMTGRQLAPMGNMELDELIDVYKEQAEILVKAGVDLFVVETMMSLAEARAALIAIKEVCDLPVMVSMTFNEDGKTLFGQTPESAVVVLQSLGADAVGINCSTGPLEMISLIKRMMEYANVPVFAKPNNGMPELIDGKTQYTMTPEEFSKYGRMIVDAGARAVGGCCGTTPKHIAALKCLVRNIVPGELKKSNRLVLASEYKVQDICLHGKFLVIGERINPTGKKNLQEELRNGKMDMVISMAEEQVEKGAKILDINMGMNGIDEGAMMKRAITEVMSVVDVPLCIDSSYVDVIEAALRLYPGKALINSISLEEKKCRPLMKLAAKYGAMCILLPLSDKGLPESLEEKKYIITKLLDIAQEEGVARENIVIDGLVTTVGANRYAALETLETIRYCKEELKLPTVCGLSNISFGLPERINVNTAFLTMAINAGLTMAICNPGQAQIVNASLASDLLLAKENAQDDYVAEVIPISQNVETSLSKDKVDIMGSDIFMDVVKGNKNAIVSDVKKAIDQGKSPQDIIDNELIPAVNKVGELFEQKKYYLPQLIAGATTMDIAIDYITPLLGVRDKTCDKGTIVMATVEGDIHDIGKNLVVLMLKNYGYRVVDLGKDVPKDIIIETAIKEKAGVIGLSALMTTTMMRMKDVVDEVKARKLPFKVVIGGAVVSQNFADEIGAEGYSKDANDAVKLVDRLLTEEV